MRSKAKFITLFVSLVLALVLVFTAASCGSNKNDETDYYLSVNGATYTSKTDAGDYLFTQSGSTYTLSSVSLKDGDTITVNELGGDASYGYSDLIGTDNFTAGTSNAAVVSYAGTYGFSLNTSFGLAVTSFTAAQSGVKIVSSTTSMTTGSTYTFTARLQYSDGTSESGTIAWSSSDTGIINIDSTGKATAVSAGTATITASSNGFTDSVTVTVAAGADVSATSVTLTDADGNTSCSLDIGDTVDLIATILPEGTTSQFLTWTTSDESIVTVAEAENTTCSNTIEAVGYGTATITASTLNSKTASFTVTVSLHSTGMSLDQTSMSVNVNASRTLTVSFIPEDATNQSYTLEYDSEYITAERSGLTITVTGVQETSTPTTLKVISADDPDIYAECSITVLGENETNVYLNTSSLQTMIKDTETLTVTAENDTISSVTWTSSNTSAATVSGDSATATVTGVAFGTTTITASVSLASGGDAKTLTCSVLVSDEYYFIYGDNVGASNWDSADYLTDKDAARNDEVLLEKTDTGVYELTRHLDTNMDFKIIYPQVSSIVDEGDDWLNIDGDYFDSTNSSSYVSADSGSSFAVTAAGTYTITLDLTGTTAKVTIKAVSIDVTSGSLTGDTTLQATTDNSNPSVELTLAYGPEGATVTADDIIVSVSSTYEEYEDYIAVNYDNIYSTNKLTVTLEQDPTVDFTVTVTVTVAGYEISHNIAVMASGSSKKDVTSVTFEQDTYYLDITSKADQDWTIDVSAYTNTDATVQDITYSSTSSYVTFSGNTATVTGVGTFTIKATSDDNADKTATATIVVYSTQFYLAGVIASEGTTWDSTMSGAGSAVPSDNSSVVFTQVDYVTYTLDVNFSSSDQFDIVFVGMDSSWSTAIKSNGYDFYASDIGTGYYTITLSLAGETPSVTFTQNKSLLTNLTASVSSGSTTLTSSDTTVVFTLTLTPSDATVDENSFSASVPEEYENILSVSTNFTAKTVTVALTGSLDATTDVTVTITLANITITETVTVVADGADVVAPQSVTFGQESYTVDMSQSSGTSWTVTVSASTDSDATNKNVTYSLKEETSGATIDSESGVVTATLPGTYTVVATAVGDESVKAEATVIFYSTYYLYGTGVGKADWSIDSHDSSVEFTETAEGSYIYTLTVEVTGTGDSGKFRIEFVGNTGWTCIDYTHLDSTTKSASFLNSYTDGDNNIEFSQTGTYTITIDLTGATPVVSIEEEVTPSRLEWVSSENAMSFGEEFTFEAHVVFSNNSTDTDGISWSSSNSSIVSIDASGNATAGNEVGTATITASYEGVDSISIEVTVSASADKTVTVSITGDTTISAPTKTTTLDVNVTNGTKNTVEWSSGNTNVATVDSSTGVVTGVLFGSTTITAKVTTTDGDTIEATATVYVMANFFYIAGYNNTWPSDYTSDTVAASGYQLDDQGDDVYSVTLDIDPSDYTYGFAIYYDGIASIWSDTQIMYTNAVGNSYSTYYYDSSNSSNSYVTSSDKNFQVTTAGNYTITLTYSDGVAKVTIILNSISVTNVEVVTEGTSPMDSTTNNTYTYTLTPEPNGVDISTFTATLSSDTDDITDTDLLSYVSVSTDSTDGYKVIVTCNEQSDTVEIHFTVNITLNDYPLTESLTILQKGGSAVAVSSISFEKEAYTYDVNDGSGTKSWSVTVKATVNGDASEQNVTYSMDSLSVASVDSTSGVVTATNIGTFTITATSVGEDSDGNVISTTCEVTFYSDTFYIIGAMNGTYNQEGWYDWPTAMDASATTLSDTFTDWAINSVSEDCKTITGTFTISDNSYCWQEFAIYFLGGDYNLAIVYANVDSTNSCSDVYYYEGQTNLKMSSTGTYDVEIDLSGTTPVLIITNHTTT